MALRADLKLHWLLALFLLVTAARAEPLALIDPRHPVDDVTEALIPVLEPQAIDNERVAPPQPRMIQNDYAYSGWLSLSFKNTGSQPIDRIIVFTHPALSRSGIFGAPLAAPRLTNLRVVAGDLPVSLPLSGPANRFASLGVHLDPGMTESFVIEVENGSHAIAVQAWDPQELAHFNTFLLLAIGIYWGILFFGVGLLLAHRLLSGGPGLISGAFLALVALLFEGASFGFGGAPWLSRIGYDPAAVLRPITLIFVCYFGVQFLRRLYSLREEMPFLDVALRLFQYSLLVAVPLVFFWGFGPATARVAALATLVVTGIAIFFIRHAVQETLLPPGWIALAIAGMGGIAISGLGFGAGAVIMELLLHGIFVIGIMLLVFAATLRSTGAAVSAASTSLAPAYAQAPLHEKPSQARPPVTEAATSYQGLWDWTIGENRLYVSPSVEAMMGLTEGALQGRERNWSQRILEEDRGLYADTLRHYIDQGNSSFAIEFRITHTDGTFRWVQLRATGLAGEDGRAARLIGVVTDITSAKVAEEEIVHEASHDSLTGIGNRAFLIANVDYALAQFREQPVVDPKTGRAIAPAVLFLDIDRFKSVNDGLGHAAGDQLLIQLTKRFSEALGPNDVIGRFGNDEFAVLMTPAAGIAEMTPPEDLAALLNDLCAQPIELAGQTIYPSVTIGIVRVEGRHQSAQEVLAEAETAMRRAKKRGHGEIETFVERRAEKRLPTISLEADLRQAIQREEMLVLYQPIMNLKTGAIAGFESLLRWNHRERGLLGPDHFVPLAEENGMIVTLGRFALSMATMQLAQWQTNFPLRPPLFVTVNVSSRQLLRSDFMRDVAGVLGSVNLATGSLKLEVTESLVFDDEARVAELLSALKARGVSLALDDYGKGYSSLSRLKALPISTVKIDKEFVANAGDHAQGDAILRSTIAMAHEMKIDVVCEGVERAEQVAELRALGTDYVQGYLFGEPMPAVEAQRFIAKHWKPEQPVAKSKAS